MRGPVHVAMPGHARQPRIEARVDQPSRLVEDAVVDHLPDARLDTRIKPGPRRLESDARAGDPLAALRGHAAPPQRELEIPDDPSGVPRIHPLGTGRIDARELGVERGAALAPGTRFERRAEGRIGRRLVEREAVEERPHVEPGAADDVRDATARGDVRERRARIALVAPGVVRRPWVPATDAVMR